MRPRNRDFPRGQVAKAQVLKSERPSRLWPCVRFNAVVSQLRRTAEVYDVVYATCAMCGLLCRESHDGDSELFIFTYFCVFFTHEIFSCVQPPCLFSMATRSAHEERTRGSFVHVDRYILLPLVSELQMYASLSDQYLSREVFTTSIQRSIYY